jgi:hypothetical protein
MGVKDTPIGGNRTVLNFTTASDLTSNKFLAAKIFDSLTAGGYSATTDLIGGIFVEKPLSGTGVSVGVCTAGETIALANAALTAGAELTVAATGKVAARTTSTEYRLGTAITSAGAANERISVFVNIDNSGLPA